MNGPAFACLDCVEGSMHHSFATTRFANWQFNLIGIVQTQYRHGFPLTHIYIYTLYPHALPEVF